MNKDATPCIKRGMIIGMIIGITLLLIVSFLCGCVDRPSEPDPKTIAKSEIDKAEKMASECEGLIEKAEKAGIESQQIEPIRQRLIDAKSTIAEAKSNYQSGNYDLAKSNAKKAQDVLTKGINEINETMEKVKWEVRNKLRNVEGHINSISGGLSDSIKKNPDIDFSCAIKTINDAKSHMKTAWGKFDTELYADALKKSVEALEYANKAEELRGEALKGTIGEARKMIANADADLRETSLLMQDVRNAAPEIFLNPVEEDIQKAGDLLKEARDMFNEYEFDKAKENAIESSKLSVISKERIEEKLEDFVVNSVNVEIPGEIRDADNKIRQANLFLIETSHEEEKLDRVRDLYYDAFAKKTSGDFLYAARYVHEANGVLREISQTLDEKMKNVVSKIFGLVIIIFVALIITVLIKKIKK